MYLSTVTRVLFATFFIWLVFFPFVVFLTSMLKEVQNAPGAWIGLNDIAAEGTYKWQSGDTYNESLSNWAKGYPENSMPNQVMVNDLL